MEYVVKHSIEGKKYITFKIGNSKKRYTDNENIKRILDKTKAIPRFLIINKDNAKVFYKTFNLNLVNYKKYEDTRVFVDNIKKYSIPTVVINLQNLKKLAFVTTFSLCTMASVLVTKKHLPKENNKTKIEIILDDAKIGLENIQNNINNIDSQVNEINELNSKPISLTQIENTQNNKTLTFEERYQQSIEALESLSFKENDIIFGEQLTNNFTRQKLFDFSKTEEWQYFIKYGEEFGVDPYLMLALATNESSLNHYDNIPDLNKIDINQIKAVGIMQHENPYLYERDIKAYNYLKDEEETVRLNPETAENIETNIKMAFMIMQNNLKRFDNNIYITLQAYNYGYDAMDKIIEKCSIDNNISVSDILTNPNVSLLMPYIIDLHSNPQDYGQTARAKTYGTYNYIQNVMRYYVGTTSTNRLNKTSTISLNFEDTIENEKKY